MKIWNEFKPVVEYIPTFKAKTLPNWGYPRRFKFYPYTSKKQYEQVKDLIKGEYGIIESMADQFEIVRIYKIHRF